jgi:hypothetical protein
MRCAPQTHSRNDHSLGAQAQCIGIIHGVEDIKFQTIEFSRPYGESGKVVSCQEDLAIDWTVAPMQ